MWRSLAKHQQSKTSLLLLEREGGQEKSFLVNQKPRCIDGVHSFKTSQHALAFYHTSIVKKGHKTFRDLQTDWTFMGKCNNYSYPICVFFRRQLMESKRLALFLPLDRREEMRQFQIQIVGLKYPK